MSTQFPLSNFCLPPQEYLPSHATHMWVKQIFSQCGKVAYVSLPTYKTSKQIKGFAFVEFEKPEEAERACAVCIIIMFRDHLLKARDSR